MADVLTPAEQMAASQRAAELNVGEDEFVRAAVRFAVAVTADVHPSTSVHGWPDHELRFILKRTQSRTPNLPYDPGLDRAEVTLVERWMVWFESLDLDRRRADGSPSLNDTDVFQGSEDDDPAARSTPDLSRRAALIAAGVLRPAEGPLVHDLPLITLPKGMTIEDLLDRDDRV